MMNEVCDKKGEVVGSNDYKDKKVHSNLLGYDCIVKSNVIGNRCLGFYNILFYKDYYSKLKILGTFFCIQ